MGFVESLKRRAKLLLYRRQFGNDWAKALVENNIWPLMGARLGPSGQLIVDGLGDPIAKPSNGALMLLRVLRVAQALHLQVGARFEINEESVLIRIDDLSILASSSDDIAVVAEVFAEQMYRFDMPGSRLILDIGANIGATGLFFAKSYACEVWAYELVPSTAERAKQNFALNPDLANQITLQAYGLSDRDQELEISVDPDHRPSNSLYQPIVGSAKEVERVTVRDATVVLGEALKVLGERKLVVKLDAEGAEYEILERLQYSGLLSRIDLLLLEWHERDGQNPDSIRSLLREAGFCWMERLHPDAPVGFIGAYKSHP
ncbi:MAG: FkbM family methyltransferase [Fimbriimonadaceae bacterium]|nr:FkbM family methyltransferase [Fimbriimonadaceae bacterium]